MIDGLWYVGLTHARSPLSVRERMRPTLEQRRAMLDRLAPLARGRLVLSTCERFEVYASVSCSVGEVWVAALADWFHVPRRVIARYVRIRRGRDVAEHLLRVAAGLDSRVLGEPQVLGQLRDAQRIALDAKALDPVLAGLCRSAIRAGRLVRHVTPINRGRQSIATLAVDAVLEGIGTSRRVIVLGSGHLAGDVVASLRSRSVEAPMVASRNERTGRALVKRCGGAFVPLVSLPRVLARRDGLIACTSATSYLVDASTVGVHRALPLSVVDLCVPRNVDPDVERLVGVRLTHLDELLRQHLPCVAGLSPALAIIRETLGAFDVWCRERAAAPRITELIQQAYAGRDALSVDERRVLHERIVRTKKALMREGAAA